MAITAKAKKIFFDISILLTAGADVLRFHPDYAADHAFG
jgi:hypothetical protein